MAGGEAMAGSIAIGANMAGHGDAVVPTVSWPGLARPSTTGGADRGQDVDGRHKHALGQAMGPARGAGHDTGEAGAAKLALPWQFFRFRRCCLPFAFPI